MDVEVGAGGERWAPADACTLPTAERPLREAEFGELLLSVRQVDRMGATWLRLVLEEAGGIEAWARDLTARESECCSFFDFAVSSDGGRVVVDVRVPEGRVEVLDGLAAQVG